MFRSNGMAFCDPQCPLFFQKGCITLSSQSRVIG